MRAIRDRIDAIDSRLVTILAERLAISREVAPLKMRHGIPVRIPRRITEVLDRCTRQGSGLGLDEGYVTDLWTRIIEEMCRAEEALFAAEGRNPG